MAEWWNELKDGEPRIFGYIVIDIVGSSSLGGPQAQIMRTKANLRNHLSRIASIYDVIGLSWSGDGGIFALLIDHPESYDLIAQCSLHFLETLSFFNDMKGVANLADVPISVRLSAHAGQGVYNKEGSLFQSKELDFLAKHEREIGVPNSVVITAAIYDQLMSPVLREAFALFGRTGIDHSTEAIAQRLYISPKPSELPESPPAQEAKKVHPLTEVIDLTARAFSKLGAKVTSNVRIEGMEVDILLEEETTIGPLRTLVECKAFKSLVGIQEVNGLAGKVRAMNQGSIQRAILVSATAFTKQAAIVAESDGIILLTLNELIDKAGGIEGLPSLEAAKSEIPEHQRWAFVVMPFKRELEDVYFFGIRHPLEQAGYGVQRADDMQFAGGILETIRQSIVQADIIIAEMTDPNANVYYEVGLAHALNKPVVMITKSIENLPFDIQEMRPIVYDTAYDLVGKLSKAIAAIKE